MGASFIAGTFKGDRAVVIAEFKRAQEEDRFRNGHEYSGGFGMASGIQFRAGKSFPDDRAADDWLADNAQKWGAALAVQIDGKPDEWRVGAWCAS